MKTLVLSNGALEEKDITNELETLQEIVGGYIEIPSVSEVFNDNVIDMIINEEGKLIEGFKPEIAIADKERGNILDVIYGNCIFASHDDEGETISLNDEQIKIIEEELYTIVELTDRNTKEKFEVRVLFI